MRVIFDRKALCFLPIKHPDLYVCANLAWIECYPDQPYGITTLDENFLKGLTDFELMVLYRNTTGENALHFGQKMRNVLFELADRIPVREVNEYELERQASQVPEKRKERYLYNPGQLTPLIQNELFKHEPVKLPKSEAELQHALKRPAVPPAPPPRPPAPTPSPSPAAPAGGAGSSPRGVGIAGLVWAFADRAWEAAGSPKDTKILLKLRRKMMDDLESIHSVKRLTSSNELGRWMKTKI